MCAENIKRIHSKIAFVTIPVLLLAARVAISVTVSEDAFAKDGRYSGDTSQAAAVSNECLNPILDSNSIDNIVDVGNCAGTVSQQDESGSAAAPITHQSANPTIELQRSTTTQPGLGASMTCEDCFDSLTAAQVSEFESDLPEIFGSSVTTIEELCDFLEENVLNPNSPGVIEVLEALEDLPANLSPSQQTLNAIEACLLRLGFNS
jgi:hypothetical protein